MEQEHVACVMSLYPIVMNVLQTPPVKNVKMNFIWKIISVINAQIRWRVVPYVTQPQIVCHVSRP